MFICFLFLFFFHSFFFQINSIIGQYAHSNQPVHHVLYLYTCAKQPWKTQKYVRRVLNELYGFEQNGLCGDEDNGEMSCWYLLSSMGLFPLSPGNPSFILTSPLFSKIQVNLPNQKKIIIQSNNYSHENIYIQSFKLNQEPYSKLFVSHSDLSQGSHLVFEMSSTPNTSMEIKDSDLPYSFSNEFSTSN